MAYDSSSVSTLIARVDALTGLIHSSSGAFELLSNSTQEELRELFDEMVDQLDTAVHRGKQKASHV